jgi:hypothetical protein
MNRESRVMIATVFTAWINVALTVLNAVQAIEGPQRAGSTGILWWGLVLLTGPTAAGALATFWPSVRQWLDERAAGLFKWTATTSVVGAMLAIVGFSWVEGQDLGPRTFPLVLRFAIMGSLALLDTLYLTNMAVIERVASSTTDELDGQPLQSSLPSPALHARDDDQSNPIFRITLEFGRRHKPP